MKTIIILLMLVSVQVNAGDHKLGFGLFTEHYRSDDPRYNENNRLLLYSYINESNYSFTAASFENSHFIDSQMVSAGYEFNETFGVTLAAVNGYKTILDTHYKGLVFIPILYLETFGFRHTIFGPAYNLSYVLKF